jgi:hypothetical protein
MQSISIQMQNKTRKVAAGFFIKFDSFGLIENIRNKSTIYMTKNIKSNIVNANREG